MKYFFLTIVVCFLPLLVVAQFTIKGTVLDENREVVIGATILIENSEEGTQTDINGEFVLLSDIEFPSLEVRFIGLETQVVQVDSDMLVVIMKEASKQLSDVVITAFGIEKSRKSAGFSVGEIDGELLSQGKEVSVGSQLVGQVAGLEVTKPSNGPAGATRIVVRGLSQFSGENRPLLVIDGVPADNTNVNTAGLYGGRDSGDGLSSINPEDIEKITVLKGPAASALYGSRAGNGVVLITTKAGAKRRGIGVEFSSNLVLEQAFLFPKFQQEYGQGANGEKPTTQQEAFDNWRSWGARLDGSLTPVFNGDEIPYSPVSGATISDFYKMGSTWNNSLALAGGNDDMTARLSFSSLQNNSIIPNTFYDRYTISALTNASISKFIDISAKVNYSVEEAKNRINLTDNPSNPSKYFTIGPANLPQSIFQDTRDDQGNPIYWSNNPFTLSPYWGPQEAVNEDTKNRLLGFVSATLNITKNINLKARAATDDNQQSFLSAEIDGTQYIPQGAIFIDDFRISERNYDLILNASQKLTSNVGLDFNGGLVRTDRQLRSTNTRGSQFINPGFVALSNMAIRQPGELNISRSRVNAAFASLNVSYSDFLYLEGSIRNDFFSVLSNPDVGITDNNSILYGSGALSFILTDAFTLPAWLSFAKYRLGYGSSGYGQINPYTLVPSYFISGQPKIVESGGVTFGQIQGNSVVDPSLKPSRTLAFETGIDVQLFRSRVGVEITYYNQKTDKHIFPSPLPASTGYSSYLTNAGVVLNQGVEASVSGKVIRRKNWKWTLTANVASNVNKVVELNEGFDQLVLGVDRTFSANIVARKGGKIGDIWGNVYQRNNDGLVVHDENGLPVIAAERQVLGNFNPDWYGGLRSSLQYKSFEFSFLLDTKQGGEILSTTSSFGYLFGTGIKTLPGRDSDDFTIVGDGVGPDGSTPNSAPARIDDYYERVSSISEENVYDASYIKLRQLGLSYALPKNILDKSKIFSSCTVSVVARNIGFLSNGLSTLGLDPESIYTATASDVGIEYAALPSTRSYGFNLAVRF